MESDKPLKAQVLSSMQLKTTDELVEIWQKNDHTKWTGDALDVVRDLLLKRLGSLPEQNNPIGVSENTEARANKLLEDYQSKVILDRFLLSVLALCIQFGAVLLLAFACSAIAWLNPGAKITVGDFPWYFFLSFLAIPIFFLWRWVKKSLEIAKKDLLLIIENGLTQNKPKGEK